MNTKTIKLKETMQSLQKEIIKTNKQIALSRNDLITSIDTMFYDTKNLEDQAKIFRIILDQSTIETLNAIKNYVKISTNNN